MSRSDGYGAGSAQRESALLRDVTGSAGVQATVAIKTEFYSGSRITIVVVGV